MKLFYYKEKIGNFGDDLNLWLWPRIAPGLLDNDEQTFFVGIGTLLNSALPEKKNYIRLWRGVFGPMYA